jgi:hypothetical protein
MVARARSYNSCLLNTLLLSCSLVTKPNDRHFTYVAPTVCTSSHPSFSSTSSNSLAYTDDYALQIAAYRGNVEALRELTQVFDVNEVDASGRYAGYLHASCAF